MADVLMIYPNTKIEIKCKEQELYKEIKQQIINASKEIAANNDEVSLRTQIILPFFQRLDEDCFKFVAASEFDDNKVEYQFSPR